MVKGLMRLLSQDRAMLNIYRAVVGASKQASQGEAGKADNL